MYMPFVSPKQHWRRARGLISIVEGGSEAHSTWQDFPGPGRWWAARWNYSVADNSLFSHLPWSLLPITLSGRWLGMTVLFTESKQRLRELRNTEHQWRGQNWDPPFLTPGLVLLCPQLRTLSTKVPVRQELWVTLVGSKISEVRGQGCC